MGLWFHLFYLEVSQMDAHVPPLQGGGLDGPPLTDLGSFFQSLLY